LLYFKRIRARYAYTVKKGEPVTSVTFQLREPLE